MDREPFLHISRRSVKTEAEAISFGKGMPMDMPRGCGTIRRPSNRRISLSLRFYSDGQNQIAGCTQKSLVDTC